MSMEARASFPYLLRFVRLLLATATALTPAVAMADMRARCNTAFDADYFYISADVEKPVLRGSVAAPFQDPLSDDAIVVGLALPGDAADRSAGVSPPASTKVEFAVSVAQGAQLYRGPDRRPLTGFDDFLTGPDGTRMLFKYRLRARGKLNAEPDFANGYSVEVAIPWIEMGGPPKPGDRMRFNVTLTNTVEGEPPVVSLSRAVTSREEMHDAAKWSEIVFVEAPTASVSGAPGALVCARVYNVKPIIDGASDDAEWTRITAFAFGAGAEAVGPLPGSAAAARSRAPSELKKVPPAPNDGKWLPPTAVAPTSRRQQDWPKLVFARYLVNRQADARKPLPSEPVSATDGRSLLITHPMDGTGPWFTYDRVDWHRIQLTRMREAGVDVAAVVFRPNRAGRLAVTALASALAALEASGADYPTACLWLDASGIKAAAPGVEPAANALYAAIREFHQCLPDRFAATVTLSKENGPGFAVPIVLAGLDSMRVNAGDVAPIRDALRVRFRAEHDRDLVVLATQPDGAWDGLVGDASATGYALGAGDRIRTAAIYAGAPGVPQGEHLLFRRARDTYRSAWRSAITDRAAWVFVDSWNDFAAACEIAPTVEYGLEYSDMTQAFSRAWRGHVEFGGHLVACTVPVSMRQGAGCAVRLTVRNTGVQTWQPGAVAILVSWNGARTRALAPIATPVEMGSLCHVTVQTPAAPSAGMHTCEVRAVRLDRAGAPMPPSPLTNALIAAVPVSVEPSDGPSIAQPATLIAVSPLRVAEGLSTHPVTLTVRNDGPQAWAQGTAILRARMFEQAPGGEPVLLDMADAAAPIAAQTLPGAEATLDVPITFARSDGTPFRLSEFGDTRYLLRWEIATDGAVQSAAILGCQEVEIVEAEFGAQFFNDFTPTELPGDRRVSVVIGVRNRGVQTWLKGKVAVGYHWYYLDGTEAVWQDEVFTINADVPPGGRIADVGAWITAPPHDGSYWLVWDFRVGDTWASTRLSARAYDTRAQLVKVARGRLQFVDLAAAANAEVTAAAGDAPASGFDTQGPALPAELTPPYSLGLPTPTTIRLPIARTGPDQSRRISFRWLPRNRPNAVRCKAQELVVAPRRSAAAAKAVHVLAAATKPGATLGITLRFDDGSEQYTSFPVSVWTGPALQGEEIAHEFPYTRVRGQEAPGSPARLFRYAITVKERKPLASLQLSESPDVVVTGISVER